MSCTIKGTPSERISLTLAICTVCAGYAEMSFDFRNGRFGMRCAHTRTRIARVVREDAQPYAFCMCARNNVHSHSHYKKEHDW